MKKTPTKQEKIGIIGLGDMGGYIADKFIRRGYQLFVCDLNEKLIEKYEKKGAIYCPTPKEVAMKADFIFDVTPNDESSKKIWLDKDGILEGATPEKILIVCATLSAEWIDELAKRCKDARFHFFDMGINGGDRGLTLACGGNKEVLKKIRPVLKAIAARVIYFGPNGQGVRYKLILNFLQAVHIIGFAQAMRIAKDLNMDLKKVGNGLSRRPGGPLTELAWDQYQDNSDYVDFKVEWITKDLMYAKKLAKNLDISLLDTALDEYKKAMEKGYAKKDWYSIVTLE